jgi:hypothetical protein
MTSFFRFVDQRAIYRWYNLIRTYAGECDWLFRRGILVFYRIFLEFTNIRQPMLRLKNILVSMIYFDSDMSKSANTVLYFDWKT